MQAVRVQAVSAMRMTAMSVHASSLHTALSISALRSTLPYSMKCAVGFVVVRPRTATAARFTLPGFHSPIRAQHLRYDGTIGTARLLPGMYGVMICCRVLYATDRMTCTPLWF